MNCPGATARRKSIAGAPPSSIKSVCSIMATASAPRGITPPVAIVVAEPTVTSSAGECPQTITSPLRRQRRQIEVASKARACFLGGNDFEELLLPRRAAYRGQEIGGGIAPGRFRFETRSHGQGLITTAV